MHRAEVVGEATHSGTSGTLFLEKSHIIVPGGQTLGVRLEVGNILRFHNCDARWKSRRPRLVIPKAMQKGAALLVGIRARRGWAGWHCLFGLQTPEKLWRASGTRAWLVLQASRPKPCMMIVSQDVQ